MVDANRQVAVIEGQSSGLIPRDITLRAVSTVEDALRRQRELQEFVRAMMVEGTDYGVIPGTAKPTLLKPGSEKLCEIYGLAITIPEERIQRHEDWEQGIFAYHVVCSLVSRRDGSTVAEGIGACNSREKRYRNQDAYTLQNTVLKMAKKRAVVDAALAATRSSGIFTQDVEDLEDDDSPPPARPPSPKKTDPTDPASITNIGQFFAACLKDFRITRTEVLKELGVGSVQDLAGIPFASLYAQIAAVKNPPAGES